MAGRTNALAAVTNELQKNVAYALDCIGFDASPLVHVPCPQKLTPTKFRLEYAFLNKFLCRFLRKSFALPGNHPALTLAGVKPYLQGAAAREGFGSSSLLRTPLEKLFRVQKGIKKK